MWEIKNDIFLHRFTRRWRHIRNEQLSRSVWFTFLFLHQAKDFKGWITLGPPESSKIWINSETNRKCRSVEQTKTITCRRLITATECVFKIYSAPVCSDMKTDDHLWTFVFQAGILQSSLASCNRPRCGVCHPDCSFVIIKGALWTWQYSVLRYLNNYQDK